MALLKLDHLKHKYDLEISKIAHIGAHKGQEVEEYLNVFPKVMIHLFEPQIFHYTISHLEVQIVFLLCLSLIMRVRALLFLNLKST